MRRIGHSTLLLTVMTVTVVTGCSSASTPSAGGNGGGTHAVLGQHQGTGSAKTTMKCLKAHGLPKTRLKQLFITNTGGAPVSQATLKKAGDLCWQPSLKGMLNTAVQRIDHCMVTKGVKLAAGGSPLADMLLLDMDSQNVRNTLHFCLRT